LGFSTYLPHRNAGLAKPYTIKEIFQKDLESLKSAELVVVVLNGASVDDGTAWEMGYAYALNTPIIGIIEDVRIRDPQLDVNFDDFSHMRNSIFFTGFRKKIKGPYEEQRGRLRRYS